MPLPDRIALKLFNLLLCARHLPQVLRFRRKVGYFPNIAHPRRYHEKMLWRKLLDHNPVFRVFCDKLATKDYVRTVCPSLQVPETLWVVDSVADCLARPMPSDTMLKCSHGWKMNHRIPDGPPDVARLIGTLSGWMAQTHGRKDHQWGYWAVPKRLFLEEAVDHAGIDKLLDISIRCVDGHAFLGSVSTMINTENMRIGYFDSEGQRMGSGGFGGKGKELPADFELPPAFYEAVRHAESLSRGVDYARYDFLYNGKTLFAGEITVYPAAGLNRSSDGVLENRVNGLWDIRRSWFLRAEQRGWRSWYAQMLHKALADDAHRTSSPQQTAA
jgi:hypothetical protein